MFSVPGFELSQESELERQIDRPKDVCQVKHCDTCKFSPALLAWFLNLK